MRAVLLFLALALTLPASAQTVGPDELKLTVTAEKGAEAPFVGEMILLTIHGIYGRHVTRERLEQPDLSGFSWMQLGDDYWYESMVDGRRVKNMQRRMALFPEEAGRLTIGPFTHHLTLVDKENAWFEHPVASPPITVDVRPHPAVEGWRLPVRRLEVSDGWSNAPDQLEPGEGVLRIIRVEAVGIAPERLPPMPELSSPSGHVFPHPEKRLVMLSPDGPISTAFWRWTIRPVGPSAILEPIEFSFFDTRERVMREVVISPQRVAMTPGPSLAGAGAPPARGDLHRSSAFAALAAAALVGLAVIGARRSGDPGGWAALRERMSARRALARAARSGDIRDSRRATHRLAAVRPARADESAVIAEIDAALFAKDAATPDLRALYRRLVGPGRGQRMNRSRSP